MNFLTMGLDEGTPACQRCGGKLRLICRMLDSSKGETVRIFKCRCGDVPTIISAAGAETYGPAWKASDRPR